MNKPYREFSAATLQKQLQYARRLVRDVISRASQESVREEALRRGVALTLEFEEKLLKRTRSAVARRLSGLSPRASEAADGAFVNAIVYQDQYNTARAELRELRKAGEVKKCSPSEMNPPPAAPPE